VLSLVFDADGAFDIAFDCCYFHRRCQSCGVVPITVIASVASYIHLDIERLEGLGAVWQLYSQSTVVAEGQDLPQSCSWQNRMPCLFL
jgi:hypothetical protein